ncbi:MAG: calcium/proton exchanger [Nitrospirae bacterium]|nr:calcium/proton exchanger [Nitrospirota bacterium]
MSIMEFLRANPLSLLLVFVPVSAVFELLHVNATWIFASSALAIIPLAGLMGKATEHLSEKMGAGIGGLLNASFGNAAELIISLMALRRGLHEVVKASITGSIIGNILLVLGLSLLAGGLKFERQMFNRTAACMGATLLTLSVIGLVVPAIFHMIVRGSPSSHEQELSLEIAVVLFLTYLLNLVFALRTHKHLYAGDGIHTNDKPAGAAGWNTTSSVLVLLGSTAFVALMSEFLVGAVEQTAATFGMTKVFVGVILVAIIGNAAEHSTAVIMAVKNQMDLAINIAIGSSIQIVLFVAPLLIFISYLFGQPMDLLFTTFEVISIGLAVGIVSLIAMDGESNWMEGVQLIAVYVILGMAFYFLP